MRALVLFALTLASVATLTSDASAFGKRKKKAAAATAYAVPAYDSCSCDGGYGSSYGGYSTSYYDGHGSSYSGGYGYPGQYHSGHYYGSPNYGSSYGYPGTYYGGTTGPTLMPGAGGGVVVPGGILPGIMPRR